MCLSYFLKGFQINFYKIYKKPVLPSKIYFDYFYINQLFY